MWPQTSRGTTDMIFVARQIQEKCQEQNKDLYMAFVDLTNAFDSINCEVSGRFCPDLVAFPTLSQSCHTLSCPWMPSTWSWNWLSARWETFQLESSQGPNKSAVIDFQYADDIDSCPHSRRASDKPWPTYRSISKFITLNIKNQDHTPNCSRQHWTSWY